MSHLGISKIIAVASGKGGVGKSTVAVNLALALAKTGASVGILDADIYGPSQPTMLGAAKQRPTLKDGVLEPIERHGIKSTSMGYLIEATAPVVWRGPVLGKAMHQLMHDTNWGKLDYLVVDLPPGTGDIQISLCQKIPVSGAVVVTTPQDMALLDVRRACEMFKKMNVPILGVVENMSMYHCSQCGHEEALFGVGGGATAAAEYDTVQLGAIPLAMQIREMTDSGVPPVVQAPDSEYAKSFNDIATKVAAILSQQPKNYAAKFPKIVVEGKDQI
jgi:ATP-binding protein involved in chromosome partitioning